MREKIKTRYSYSKMLKKTTFIERLLEKIFTSGTIGKSGWKSKEFIPNEYLYLIYRF